jgi:3-hydroxyacyl-[acyl-carrier-protein] dehydratase
MLRNDFYQSSIIQRDGDLSATIKFNKEHRIFEGHFPGSPVVPGVCMIQIVRELMEDAWRTKLQVMSGDNIKFLAVINPNETPEVQASVQFISRDEIVEVQASLFLEQVTYFKFKGTFRKSAYEL